MSNKNKSELEVQKEVIVKQSLPTPSKVVSVKCNFCGNNVPHTSDKLHARIVEQCRTFKICFTCWDTMLGHGGYVDRNTYKLDRK